MSNLNADSIAQSFVVPVTFANGVYVTGIDLYFASTGGETVPVFVKICEMNNGTPTDNLIKNGFGVIDSTSITTSTTGNVATKCNFQSLVYLKPSTEYCIKILSNSIKYKLWIAQMGETRVDKPLVITEQPSTGVLFRSQNNSTWTPDQLQDLKFKLYYAKFNTSKSASINFTNSPVSTNTTLPPNPFFITNASTTVIVSHPNHGLIAGKLVTYSGSTYSALNAQYAVTSVIDSDRYVVTLVSNATSTDSVGGSVVLCKKSIRFESINIQSAEFVLPNTGIEYTAKLTGDSSKESAYRSYKANEYNNLDASKYVYSSENEQVFLGGSKSLDLIVNLYSTDSSVSPLLHMDSLSVALKMNKLDNRSDETYLPVVAESNPTNNSAESRYISTAIRLEDVASNVRFMFTTNIPYSSTIELWYRTTMNSSVNPLANVSWVQVPLSLENINSNVFTNIEVDATPSESFTEYQSKIVFKSANPALAPRIRDFRAIAFS